MARRIVDGKHFCSRCKEWLPVDSFYPNKRAFTGLDGRCKKCNIDRTNYYHSSNLDRALKDIVLKTKSNAKYGSARRRGFLENSCVNFEFLKGLWDAQGGKCAITGQPMTHVQGKGKCLGTNVSVDRIRPAEGYVEGNVRLVCKAVNYAKWTGTDRELIEWAKAIATGPVAQRLSDVASQSPQKVQN